MAGLILIDAMNVTCRHIEQKQIDYPVMVIEQAPDQNQKVDYRKSLHTGKDTIIAT